MYQDALLFLTGSWAYPAIEMLWRGETHSSMALAGGICLCLINHICCGVLEDNNIFSRCLAGAGIITGVELVLGLVLNCLLGFDIWDYSNVPLNLLGQVCLPYSFLWMGISLPVRALCELCREDSLEELEIVQKKTLTFRGSCGKIYLASDMERCPSGLRS